MGSTMHHRGELGPMAGQASPYVFILTPMSYMHGISLGPLH